LHGFSVYQQPLLLVRVIAGGAVEHRGFF
jgi:hypothetical protein